MGCALARLGHSIAHVKIGVQRPLGAEILSSKKVDLVGWV